MSQQYMALQIAYTVLRILSAMQYITKRTMSIILARDELQYYKLAPIISNRGLRMAVNTHKTCH